MPSSNDAVTAFTRGAPSQRELRDIMVGDLRRELLGPTTDEEILEERPEDRYLIGMLAPAGEAVGAEDTENDLAAQSDDGDDADQARTAQMSLRQSSLGLTFAAEIADEAAIRVTATYATYTPWSVTGAQSSQRAYKRVPRTHVEEVPLVAGDVRKALPDQAELYCRIRDSRGYRFVTLTLVNRNAGDGSATKVTLFQPKLVVVPVRGARIVEPPRERLDLADPDEDTDALLYRDVEEYAIGHGCAVIWDAGEDGARVLATEIIPSHEVPAVAPLADTAAETRMYALMEVEADTALAAALRPLAEEYEKWIEGRAMLVETLADPEFERTAGRHLAECRKACERMHEGIDLIGSDPEVAEAFRFANAAMAEQQVQARKARARRDDIPDTSGALVPRWHPFQLGFIILNLPSLADPFHPDRPVTDLLWFPTGGGKTEAYLGLSAFAIGHRRLVAARTGTPGHGCTILMRYTLRLLTAQQFERAAIMICACEKIRRAAPETWGEPPITIGLWVGVASTPNRFVDAKKELDNLHSHATPLEKHPFVLRSCPWCGEGIALRSFEARAATHSFHICCVNPACDFTGGDGLPVVVVDTDVYARPPAMLIGTVDKFARLPWVSGSASIFGHTSANCPKHGYVAEPSNHGCATSASPALPPPALIIQDELHLISGPLGSLVGLYEVAVDYLASREVGGVRYGPKLVASTATIRRSSDQVRGLFARDVRLFPPPALDPFDSFFARRVPLEDHHGRLYVGICAFGKSAKTTLIRVYTSLLQSAARYRHLPDLVDPYWTLLGYFNSLAQLGGAVSLVQDDVASRLKAHFDRGIGPDRPIAYQEEITSRVGSTEIPERLKQMQRPLSSGRALDVLLASNMISVGLDVDRLGLMVISAQPKRTAEYIQASSRVGRRYPGLVLTIYNWMGPRDLSHYERFGVYHRALYRHVEATSVTPFAPRSRDKGLHAIAIAALRLTHPNLAANDAARRFDRATSPPDDFVRYFLDRVRQVDPDEVAAAERELDALLDKWETRAAHGSSALVYQDQTAPDQALLVVAGSKNASAIGPQTLNSLRDVEEEARWHKE